MSPLTPIPSRLGRLLSLFVMKPGLFLVTAVASLSSLASAETAHIPTRDVAILVDISRSIAPHEGEAQKDTKAHRHGTPAQTAYDKELAVMSSARDLVISLIQGRPVLEGSFAPWNADVQNVSPEMLALFGRFLNRSEGLPPEPLTAAGRTLYLSRAGRLVSVLAGDLPYPVARMENVTSLILEKFPLEFPDNSTCYWYAMARTAEIFTNMSPEGYYLFVISDEEDDPDYSEKGPPGHSLNDYQTYMKEFAQQYPVTGIHDTISKSFDLESTSPYFTYRFKQRSGEFARTLIARFRQYAPGTPGDRHEVMVSWYAMGVKPPQAVEPALTPAEATVAFKRPDFSSKIQLLGGLGRRGAAKVFTYDKPLVVWQVPFGEATGLSSVDFDVVEADHPSQPLSASSQGSPRLRGPKTRALKDLGPGTYHIKVVQRGGGLESEPATIEIRPTDDWIFPILASTSGLAALGIFIWTWFSLRQKTSTA